VFDWKRQNLERDMWEPRHREELLQLAAHDIRATHPLPERRLAEYNRQLWRAGLDEDPLPSHPELDFDLHIP
jgi:hypothetical protein